jgi:hypothetical protein
LQTRAGQVSSAWVLLPSTSSRKIERREFGTEGTATGVDVCTRIPDVKTKAKNRRFWWLGHVSADETRKFAGQITARKVMTLDPSLHELATKVQDCEALFCTAQGEAFRSDQRIHRDEALVDNAILAAEKLSWKDWTVKAVFTMSVLTCAAISTISSFWLWIARRRKKKEMERNDNVGREEVQMEHLERRRRLHARSWE